MGWLVQCCGAWCLQQALLKLGGAAPVVVGRRGLQAIQLDMVEDAGDVGVARVVLHVGLGGAVGALVQRVGFCAVLDLAPGGTADTVLAPVRRPNKPGLRRVAEGRPAGSRRMATPLPPREQLRRVHAVQSQAQELACTHQPLGSVQQYSSKRTELHQAHAQDKAPEHGQAGS